MSFRFYVLILFHSLFVAINGFASEVKTLISNINREEDLRVILEKTFLREEKLDQVMTTYIAQNFDQSEYAIPQESLSTLLNESLKSEDALNALMEPYRSFSDDEIHELRSLIENEIVFKYAERSFSILKSNIQVVTQTINKILENGLELSEVPSKKNVVGMDTATARSNSPILKITKDNFHEEAEESDLPIILDVYADWCRPCQLFSKTFEEIYDKYKEECRFGKVNSDEENMLVTFLKVKAYPTIVFLYKGKVISREVGNLSKEKFEEKVKHFLSEIKEN